MRSPLPFVLASVVSACASPVVPEVGDPPPSPAAPPPPVVEERVDTSGVEAGDAWIFDPERIHEVEIAITAEAMAASELDPATPVPGVLTFDSYAVPDVGLKLRGKIGSYRGWGGKPKLEVDFNTLAPGRTFFGLKEILLNNEVVDCSGLKEAIGYWTLAALGEPALRTSWAHLVVNGADYGLYLLLESPDDRFLARAFEDPSGNLYDGKYLYDRATGQYTLLDFGAGLDAAFQLEEGTDVGNADIAAISAAWTASVGTEAYLDVTGQVIDWERFHRYLAAEQLLGHNDGYAMNQNNYRVYFDPSRGGRARWIPWDLDYAFLEDGWWGMDWRAPRGNLAAGCWADADCLAAQRVAMFQVLNQLDLDAVLARYDAWTELIRGPAAADPRRECAIADIRPSRVALRDWIAGRPDSLRVFWNLP